MLAIPRQFTTELESTYSGKRILVTGGASFIGSHVAELLVASGAVVIVADDLSSGKIENLSNIHSQVAFVQGDLRDQLFANAVSEKCDAVFHLAASHGGRGYIETHPVECVNNMSLDHTVFAAAAKAGCQKIIFASSACVYPTNLQDSTVARRLLRECDAGFSESGKAFADGEYGWAKLIGELQLNAFHKQFGIDAISCRIFTAYGERENESHAVIALIAKALLRMDPFPIWGDGLQTRNFTYVRDTALGMVLAGAKLKGFDTINLGSPDHITILELLECIFTIVGWRPNEIKRELDKPVGVLSRAADVEKVKRLLGWSPTHSLAEGVGNTIEWYSKTLAPDRAEHLERLLMER